MIIGIILALSSFVMVKVYLDQQRRAYLEEAQNKLETFKASIVDNQASVLVAKEEIPKGVEIKPENLAINIIPKEYVQPQAISSLDRIEGMITIAPFSPNEQITLSKLTLPIRAGGLAEVTPVGKRAVTVSVDNIASLVGMIRVGDYVDVISVVPVPVQTPQGQQVNQVVIPLFQNILVLAVGQDIGRPQPAQTESRYRREEKPAEPSPLITLALTPQEANLVAFIQEQGKVRLTLRSPADSEIRLVEPASWDTVFQHIMPSNEEQVRPTAPAPQPVEVFMEEPRPKEGVVEIYRGQTKDTLVLPK